MSLRGLSDLDSEKDNRSDRVDKIPLGSSHYQMISGPSSMLYDVRLRDFRLELGGGLVS